MTGRGRESFDLVLTGGSLIDVASLRIVRGDIAISGDRIAAVTTDGSTLEGEETIDVSGAFVAPGLIDSHMHIESTMLSPIRFAEAAVARGTTTVFVDPHEIANVLGRRGIDMFLEQAELAAIDIRVGIPACVPATTLEDAGASIGLDDIRSLLPHPRVFGLAEMMDCHGVIEGTGDSREKVDLAFDYGKAVDGHAPEILGDALDLYKTNGKRDGVVRVQTDHECTTAEEAIEKREAGIQVAIRHGSATRDLDRVLPGLVRRYGTELDGFMLCSDDVDTLELERDGHVDRIVRRARDLLVAEGVASELAAIVAIRLATLSPAKFFTNATKGAAAGASAESGDFAATGGALPMGEIAVGARADLVVFRSLDGLEVGEVICGGKLAARGGEYFGEMPAFDPSAYSDSVHLPEVTAAQLRIPYDGKDGAVRVRIIEAVGDSLVTPAAIDSVESRSGELLCDSERDIAKLAVFERHGKSGSRAAAFVRGLGLRRGAIASTVAHDSHNLIVAGADDESMAAAANRLREIGGGLAVTVDGEVHHLALPIAGLMSAESLETVAAGLRTLLESARATGSPLVSPFMTLSFLALPVIPDLKLTNRGLVDVRTLSPVELLAD